MAIERLARHPEHRRPQPHEQGAPLGVPALVLVDGLRPDPQDDAEGDRGQRDSLEMPAAEPATRDEIGHALRTTRPRCRMHTRVTALMVG